ncbi:MAG: energy-coupling factor transporter ATPase [Filifactoraceae bacterium]
MSIKVENLRHVYNENTPFESIALENVSFEIKDGEFIGIIGHTGSGKSTLVQHLNGLLKACGGSILVDDMDITDKGVSLVDVRKKVGLVFQYPEYQLFEETIAQDIAFGPNKLGLSKDEVYERVKRSMELVGLDYNTMKDKSPFELSGGQKRRVAIAGVIAMKPRYLILDEPTAGLDPYGRDEIFKQIQNIHKEEGTTVILVSHSMEDISRLVGRIIVMNKGEIVYDDSPRKIFRNREKLESIGLGVPKVVELVDTLRTNGFEIDENIINLDEVMVELLKVLGGGKGA